jgi:Prolipoprotein diacylglyceryl transferase
MLVGMGALAAIPSPSTNVIHFGPLTVHVYGLCYALAIMAALAIMRRRWEAPGGSRELVYDVALWACLRASSVGASTSWPPPRVRRPIAGGGHWRSGRAAWGSGAASR